MVKGRLVRARNYDILAEVPEKGGLACHLSDAELLSRVRSLHVCAHTKGLGLEMANARANGLTHLADSIRDSYISRMWDLSAFANAIK